MVNRSCKCKGPQAKEQSAFRELWGAGGGWRGRRLCGRYGPGKWAAVASSASPPPCPLCLLGGDSAHTWRLRQQAQSDLLETSPPTQHRHQRVSAFSSAGGICTQPIAALWERRGRAGRCSQDPLPFDLSWATIEQVREPQSPGTRDGSQLYQTGEPGPHSRPLPLLVANAMEGCV